MGFDEDCLIVCAPPFDMYEHRRVVDVSMSILFYDTHMNQLIKYMVSDMNLDLRDRLDEVVKQHMRELAGAPTALAVLNTYEHTKIIISHVYDAALNKAPAKTTSQLDRAYEHIKTTRFVPFTPCCEADQEAISDLRAGSRYRITCVEELIKKAKLQVRLEQPF